MKVAHIFSDEKFIDKHIIKYENCDFYNSYFYLKKANIYDGKNNHQVTFVKPDSTEYFELIRQIDQYDIVILYFLQNDKIKLVEEIWNSKVIIIWSFYGSELYSLPTLKYKMLSSKSLNVISKSVFFVNLDRFKDFLRKIFYAFHKNRTKEQRILHASKRINYFLWYNKFEYEFLNSRYKRLLPPFLLSTLNNRMEDVVPEKQKNESIIIGNSRNPYNNHLDTIQLLRKSNYQGSITIPFSYGVFPQYVEKVKAEAAVSGLHIEFIENFVPYEEYIADLNSHSTAIFPSFRQMGLGNIFIAIRCGIKIYLSEKNPTLKWLRSEGMRIYSIEQDLEKDLRKDNLKLGPTEMELNNMVYSRMVDKKNDLEFFDKLKNLVENPQKFSYS